MRIGARITATLPKSRRTLIKTAGKLCGRAACGYITRLAVLNTDNKPRLLASRYRSRRRGVHGVCRWTSRDTCYHFARHGIFIAGAGELPGMVIDRAARQPVTALKPIPARNFQTNRIQLVVQEPSILRPALFRRLFPQEGFARKPVSSYSNIWSGIDEKPGARARQHDYDGKAISENIIL